MKRIITAITLSAVFLMCIFTSVLAVSDEMIANGTFEDSDISAFTRHGDSATISRSAGEHHNGSYSLCVSGRTSASSGVAVDVADEVALGGNSSNGGGYVASCWVKSNSGAAQYRIVIKYLVYGAKENLFVTGAYTTVGTSWTQITATGSLWGNLSQCVYAYVYIETASGTTTFYVDDMSLYKNGAVSGSPRPNDITVSAAELSHIGVEDEARSNETTVGVIRWDAWYGHSSQSYSVCNQVEKTLSPAKYHFRAPFYAEINEQGGISIPNYTQEICDEEIKYASEAGIDYFIYNYYSDAMSLARRYHQTSAYRDEVKMAMCLSGSDRFEHIEMQKMLGQSYYMTVLGGRPLIYYFCSDNMAAVAEDIEYYRGMCSDLGLPAPYVVLYNTYYSSVPSAYTAYADAVAHYAVQGYDGEDFATLQARAEGYWDELKAQSNTSTKQFVPTVTTGWHAYTRYENPVTWISVNARSWSQYATASEIQRHLENAFEYLNSAENADYTKANTISIYAWNEHDEGGWLCPTLAVDENGNQLYDVNGEKMLNTSRLEAVKAAISKYKSAANEKTEGSYYANFEGGSINGDLTVNTNAGTVSLSADNACGKYSAYFTGGTQLFHGVKLSRSVVDTVTGGKGGRYKLKASYYFDTTATIRVKAYVGASATLDGSNIKLAQLAYGDGYTATQNGYIYSEQVTVTGGVWSDVEFEIMLPSYFLSSNALELFIADDGGKHTYYIDNISFEPVNQIAGVSLDLGSTLTMNYKALLDSKSYKTAQMRFTQNGVATLVGGAPDAKSGYMSFAYGGITPECLTDTVTAELILDGVVCATNETTVKAYCDKLYNKAPELLGYSDKQYSALKTLLADLLEYGAALQQYSGHSTEAPANDSAWVSASKSTFNAKALSPIKIISETTSYSSITSAGLYCGNENKLYFTFESPNESDISVCVKQGNSIKMFSLSELDFSNGKYILMLDGIKATQYKEAVTVTLSECGNEIQTATYNVDAYISAKYTTKSLGALVKAISNYGTSAKAYFDAIHTDHSFEGEDDLFDDRSGKDNRFIGKDDIL